MHRIRFCVAPLVAAAALAACNHSTPDAKTTDSTTAAAPAAAPAAPNVLTITATDYAFDAPAQTPAGFTTIRVVDNGKEVHQAALLRIEQGKSYADFADALKTAKPDSPPPSWVVTAGGPNPPMPNGTAESMQYLAPGTYAIVCFVPSPDGTPHIAKGMMRELTVTPSSAAAAAAPNADATVTLADYTFTTSAPLTPGHNVVRVTNSGPQPHEIVLVHLQPGKTGADFAKWAMSMKGPPPGALEGGVAAMAPGDTIYFPADLTPGNYAFVCFVPDVKDGKPHMAHGMVQDFEVKGT